MQCNDYAKQTLGTPLFGDLIWARPENKAHAGKLLLIGGTSHGFHELASAYNHAEQAGIGVQRVLMPDALQTISKAFFDTVLLAPSTPSGSFAAKAMHEWHEESLWADGVLFPGDMGRNSETAIVLEHYLEKSSQHVTITKDALDIAVKLGQKLIMRPNTTLVLALGQLQQLCQIAKVPLGFTSTLGILQFIEQLQELSLQSEVLLVCKHNGLLLVAHKGKLISTPYSNEDALWSVQCAAYIAVWTLQSPQKQLEAAACAAYELATKNTK